MELKFRFLDFEVKDERVIINGFPFSSIQIAGENKDSHFGNKMVKSSEETRLKYLSHELKEDALVIYMNLLFHLWQIVMKNSLSCI